MICADPLLFFSFVGFVAAINGGSLAGIIPTQLLLTIAMIWVCVIHFNNFMEEIIPSVRASVSMFLLISLFVTLLCSVLLILAGASLIHF